MTSDNPQQRPAPRPPGKVTAAYVERAALAYLERFSSSAENLRRVLVRKVERRCRLRDEEPESFLALVDEALRRMVESGLVDDRRYAEARAASLRWRGGSARLIRAKLAAKGVEREAAAAALANDTDESERAAAEALARRRRLGPYRTRDRAAYRDKDMAALVRAGFSYGLARSVIDEES
jgi:regulatory protein